MSDIINLYMNDSWRGPGKVVSNLKKGLQQLNIDVNINPPIDHITENSRTYCLQNIPEVLYSNKRPWVVFGPNLCVLPTELPPIMQQDYRKFIVNSDWTYNLYSRFLSTDNLDIWAVGVDTDLFYDTKNDTKTNDCLLYYKNRDNIELHAIINILQSNNQSYKLIEYGKYNETDFLKTISQSKYCIMLNNTESQGIAVQEIMSSNLPLFVWDCTIWDYMGEANKIEASSVPYWSNICGIKCTNNIDTRFKEFLENYNKYIPREYILQNFTLVKGAENLIKI